MFSATVTYLLGDRNGLCIQHVEHSGSQTISSIFGQPALAGKDIFDPFGWHSNRQLINQPAALRSGSIMAELQGGRETITSRDVGVFFSRSMCVCERHWDSESLAAPHPSLTSTFLISPTSEPWDLKLSREPASKPCTPSGRSSHNLSVWVWLAPMMITKALLVVLASRSKPVQMVTWYGMTAQEGDDT